MFTNLKKKCAFSLTQPSGLQSKTVGLQFLLSEKPGKGFHIKQ